MLVTDVKCSQATIEAEYSKFAAVVRAWHRTHVVKGRPEGPSVAFRDETDIISQVYV